VAISIPNLGAGSCHVTILLMLALLGPIMVLAAVLYAADHPK
jgi:hypothetical protein